MNGLLQLQKMDKDKTFLWRFITTKVL